MGKKQEKLTKIITDSGIANLSYAPLLKFEKNLLYSKYKDEIVKVFRLLGGIDNEYTYRGNWDIVTDKFIVEFDEQLHFNEYRLITLKSSLYNELKSFPLETYKDYCIRYKENCLNAGSFGGKWTNASCEKMFGIAQTQGDLNGNGSPRWKQRAFYDFVKDMSQLITNIPVVRISIYDVIDYQGEKYRLGDLLESDYASEYIAYCIQEMINERLNRKCRII